VARVLAYPDGGWGLVPLYRPQPHPGFLLLESPVDYSRRGEFLVPVETMYRQYRSAHGIKLSIHGDGFLQFSRADAQGVISGRDPVTGESRGFGYQSFRPDDPPRSGPMFGLGAWGLDEFDLHGARRSGALIVDERHLYFYPAWLKRWDAYMFEFWPLPRYALPHVRIRHGLTMLAAPRHPYYSYFPFHWIVLDLGNPTMFLGLVVTAHECGWDAPSGTSLHTASDRRITKSLQAICPPPWEGAAPSADWEMTGGHPLPPGRRVLVPPIFVDGRLLADLDRRTAQPEDPTSKP
jgi:hypothetical protein